MDEQIALKSETKQSDIRQPNVLRQDHQGQSTSPMDKQITLMTTDEFVPLGPTFQKLEMSLTNRRTSRKPINQISDTHDYRRACATETHFSETRNVTDAYKQQKSNTPWAVSRWHTELMDEQTNKSETDQSDIRRPNVLLQDHQWQSTSAVTKHA